MANDASLPLCYEVACGDIEKIEDLVQKAQVAFACPEEGLRGAIEAFEGLLTAFKAGTMKYKDDGADEDIKGAITKVRTKAREEISGVVKEVYGRPFDEVSEELRGLHADTVYYVGLLEEYYSELTALKAKANVIEFDDALHYAIDILEHEEAADELRERYEYIFVDEYQDSNYLQEEIVEKIARSDNLFMVGDIKQCIYKFRLAEPEIFKARAEAYAAAGDADPDGTAAGELLLHISSNFRSKKNVTEPVNTIFGEIMDGYDDTARLHCTAGDEYPGFAPRIHLVVNGEFDEDAPEKNDAEGAVIAEIIRDKLGKQVLHGLRCVDRVLHLI